MEEVRGQLQDMGFSAAMIEGAVRNSNGDLESAIEWIEKKQQQQEDQKEQETVDMKQQLEDEAANQPVQRTEEEKAAKLQQLRDRAAVRKAEQAKQDVIDNRKNEEIRKKKGEESAKAMEDLNKKQAQIEAEKRKKEKIQEAAAKKRVLDQIEADKRARRAERESKSQPVAKPSSVQADGPPPVQTAPKKLPTESKIRFRLPGSPQPVVKTFALDATVEQVFEQVAQDCGADKSAITLKLTFPTRVIDSSDFAKTVKEADLVNVSAIVEL